MRWRLLEGLADVWNAALDQRMSYSVGSPVTVLDALLRQRRPWENFYSPNELLRRRKARPGSPHEGL